MATPTSRHRRTRDDLYYRKLVDGGMVYDAVTGRVHHFNATAAKIWESCQLGQSREQIVSCLARDFSLDLDSAEADVEAMLTEFASSDLFAR